MRVGVSISKIQRWLVNHPDEVITMQNGLIRANHYLVGIEGQEPTAWEYQWLAHRLKKDHV